MQINYWGDKRIKRVFLDVKWTASAEIYYSSISNEDITYIKIETDFIKLLELIEDWGRVGMLREVVGFLCYIFTLFFLVSSTKVNKRRIKVVIKKLLIFFIILAALEYIDNLEYISATVVFVIVNNELLEQ